MTTIDSMDMEWAIMRDRTSGATMLPRYTPMGWWECDVAELTDSGFLREYEIKTSRADFRRDALKSGSVKTGPNWRDRQRTTKHELLATRHTRAPNNFFFVVPEGLIPVEDVPEWAGLIYVYRRTPNHWPEKRVVKRAPRIHGEKKERLGEQMLSCCAGRLAHLYSQQYFRFAERRLANAKRLQAGGGAR
jgi:hypothetical protein